ncbi:hypothetical protein WJX84_006184 [Apatococcus fuscideae]|uniref:FHA domain-containing protein n=1 Tax=Apatococcus fuscideae TaxID=2026836 RepID=A0AAW1T8G7_9CHLO
MVQCQEPKKTRVADSLVLEVLEGPCAGASLSKNSHWLPIGRTARSKFQIKDPSISEQHAELCWTGCNWELQDLDSTCGTYVNGARLTARVTFNLKDGDLIRFGADTVAKAEIVPIPTELVTVEQYLQAECCRLVQQLKGSAELHASQLRKKWSQERSQIVNS